MLHVNNLCKRYEKFALDNISFDLPAGYILGFIGRNGAGKSTTIKCMLGINPPDSGRVEILGMDMATQAMQIRCEVGYSAGETDCYPNTTVSKLGKVYGTFFDNWDADKFARLLDRFGIEPRKKIRELSSGMRVKLGVAMALSRDAKLLVLDEPTSGLDPVARDELLDILQRIVEDGNHSVLFSTHITGDLDKVADFIVFIDHGKVVANAPKDELLGQHALISGGKADLTDDLIHRMIGVHTTRYGFKGLIRRDKLTPQDKVQIDAPNLEDIMVYYAKEEVAL